MHLLTDKKFDYAWVSNPLIHISLFNHDYGLKCVFQADSSSEDISEPQQQSLSLFLSKQHEFESKIDRLLKKYIEENHIISSHANIDPKTLLLKRDGSFAILADCSWDVENGIAIILSPEEYITIQSEFL